MVSQIVIFTVFIIYILCLHHHQQCWRRHYVFGLSILCIHSFFWTDIVTTISPELLEQFW